MFGGMVVDDEKDARALSAIPPEQDGPGDVAAGDAVELPPCQNEVYLAEIERQKGRPCPRPGVAIDPDNLVPLELMQLSIGETTRHLVAGVMRAAVPRSERLTIMRRVAAALRDPVVLDRLYPKREKEA